MNVVATAHALNLKAEKEDVEELLEVFDGEQDELLMHQNIFPT